MPTPTPKPPAPASPRSEVPIRVATLGVFHGAGEYVCEAVYEALACGCIATGAGILPAPFRVQFCAGHAAYPALLAERDALRAALRNLVTAYDAARHDEADLRDLAEYADEARQVMLQFKDTL